MKAKLPVAKGADDEDIRLTMRTVEVALLSEEKQHSAMLPAGQHGG